MPEELKWPVTKVAERPSVPGAAARIATAFTPGVVAVTGASGLIGRRLLPALAQSGAQVRVLTHHYAPEMSAMEVHGDLGDESALRSLVEGAKAVVHLAAVAHTSLDTPEEKAHAREVNVEGTRRLLRLADEAGVLHFVLLSSAHVYAGQQGENLDEESPQSFDTVYSALKYEAEQLAIMAWGKSTNMGKAEGMEMTILRPCLTYGPGVRFNLQGLMRAVRRGYYVQVRGANTVRSLASVDTVAAAIVHLLGSSKSHGTFNVADAAPVVLEDWVNRLADRMGVHRPWTAPPWALERLGAVGSAAQKIGLPAPLTRDTLGKLTSSFSLNVDKLAATGFKWPMTQDEVISQMIEAEFGRASRSAGP